MKVKVLKTGVTVESAILDVGAVVDMSEMDATRLSGYGLVEVVDEPEPEPEPEQETPTVIFSIIFYLFPFLLYAFIFITTKQLCIFHIYAAHHINIFPFVLPHYRHTSKLKCV